MSSHQPRCSTLFGASVLSGLTRLRGGVQVFLQEGQRADPVRDSGRVEELPRYKLPRCAAQMEKPWREVKLSWI